MWNLLLTIALYSLPALIVGAFIHFVVLPRLQAKRVDRSPIVDGHTATAKVLSIANSRFVVDDETSVLMLHVEVQPEVGESYDAAMETLVSSVKTPQVGDILSVRFDPQDRSRVEVAQDLT